MKKNYTGLFMCGALLASSLTTSCSSMSDRSLVKVQAISLGAAGGAALGAAAGAAAGALAGGNGKSVGTSALIGAGIGLIGGIIAGDKWGDHVVKEKEAYKSEIEWRQNHIAVMNQWTSNVEKANADIQKQIQSGKISAKCYDSTVKYVADMNKVIDEDIARAKNSGAADSADVSSRIAALEKQRTQLQDSLNQLGSVVEKA